MIHFANSTIFKCSYERDHMETTVYDNTKEIHDVLLQIGMPANLIGFAYATRAVQLVLANSDELQCIVRGLYVHVANDCNTTPQRVERALRHAIGVTWSHGDVEFIQALFKNSVNPLKGQPTNTQFIARLYYYFANSHKA